MGNSDVNKEWWAIKRYNYYRFIFLACVSSFVLSILISLPFNFVISDIWWSYLPYHIFYLITCSLILLVFQTLGRILNDLISLKIRLSIYRLYFRVTVGFIFVFPIFSLYVFLSTVSFS